MEKKIDNLESEVHAFANKLAYWGQYLSEKLLTGTAITDQEIGQAYNYLLEDLGLAPASTRPAIVFKTGSANTTSFKNDLHFSKLENVEGVNALSEGQVLEFSPNLSLVFGENGAGKSGYVRLLKKVFYSKSPEDIQPNVYSATTKRTAGKFTFNSGGSEVLIDYPGNASNSEFKQFAVFDGKSALKHLENKNQFEFRPAGLNFFAALTELVRKVELKLEADITSRQSVNNYPDLFDGESEIKTLLLSMSGKTDTKVLKRYTPFTEEDKKAKEEKQKQYDEIILASRSKDKEITTLNGLKQMLNTSKQAVGNLNRFFNDEHLNSTAAAIKMCLEKEEAAKKEGIENFSNDNIKNIGSPEWKNFIEAAEKFATQQHEDYPSEDDRCILCHQSLSDEAQKLISNYWSFIKSLAEKEAKNARDAITNGIISFEKLNFDLFPEDNVLTNWLKEKFPGNLEQIKTDISTQKELCIKVVDALKEKDNEASLDPFQIRTDDYSIFEKTVNDKLLTLSEDKPDPAFEGLKKELVLLTHKEKLNLHFSKIEKYIEDQKWILTANKANWGKRNITDTEKDLSSKYFNQKYIDTFNKECKKLEGSFGIDVSHTGAGGTSFRQLFIKGRNPAAILSEGEQKVIAIADFLAEMELSEINKGMIFDDPVTSLDHARKEIIAKRLVEVAHTKQVTIFTHDLFFLLSLQYYSANSGGTHKAISLYKTGGLIGITKPTLPWIASNVAERCGWLKNDLVRITKLQKTVDPDTYRLEAKAWCGLLREAWERTVEERLFKGVVSRYSPGIETQKMKYLDVTKILIDEINAGMTKTSKWVHDQASGQNSPTPKPDELQVWVDEFEVFIKTKCKAQ